MIMWLQCASRWGKSTIKVRWKYMVGAHTIKNGKSTDNYNKCIVWYGTFFFFFGDGLSKL